MNINIVPRSFYLSALKLCNVLICEIFKGLNDHFIWFTTNVFSVQFFVVIYALVYCVFPCENKDVSFIVLSLYLCFALPVTQYRMHTALTGFVLKHLESYRSTYLINILNSNFSIKKMHSPSGLASMPNTVLWIRIRGINISKHRVLFRLKMET